jgi:anti-sigma28 factor (negative regulator of flagellin synthesis)
MMSTDIVNEIARLIQQRNVTLKNRKDIKDVKADTGISARRDEVELSSAAEAYAHAGISTSEFEKEQGMKVERLKALVSAGNYKMDNHVVEAIAERITNMLI